MKLTYQVTLADVTAYYMEYFFCSPGMQKNRRVNRWTGPACCLCLAVFPSVAAGRPLIFWMLCCVAAGAVSFLLFPRKERKAVERVVNSSAKKGQLDKMMGQYTMELGEDEIITDHTVKSARIPYSKVMRIGQQDGRILLYVGEREAYIVPPSAFAEMKDKDEFLRILEEKRGKTSA